MLLFNYKNWRTNGMKKILFIFALMLGFTVMPVSAKTAPVQAMQDFSFKNPSQTFTIKVLSNLKLNDDTMLHEGYYVAGNIMSVSNSTFVFVPIKYQNFHNEVFDIEGNYPAKFVQMIETSAKLPAQGVIAKDAKFLLDFIETENTQKQEVNTKYETPEGGVAPQVNRSKTILLDDRIPRTTKEFPGIKLNSFDNGSNFNLEEPSILAEPRNVNINDLKF